MQNEQRLHHSGYVAVFRYLKLPFRGEKSRDLRSGSTHRLETGRDQKIMPDLYRESVAKNTIRRVIIEKP